MCSHNCYLIFDKENFNCRIKLFWAAQSARLNIKIRSFILKNKSPTHILGEKSLCERVVVAQPTKSLYKPFSKIGCAEHVYCVILRLCGRIDILRAMIEEFNRPIILRVIYKPLIFALRKSPWRRWKHISGWMGLGVALIGVKYSPRVKGRALARFWYLFSCKKRYHTAAPYGI